MKETDALMLVKPSHAMERAVPLAPAKSNTVRQIGNMRTTGAHHEKLTALRESCRTEEIVKRPTQAQAAKKRHIRTKTGKNNGPPGSFPMIIIPITKTTGTTTKTVKEIPAATKCDSRNVVVLDVFIFVP